MATGRPPIAGSSGGSGAGKCCCGASSTSGDITPFGLLELRYRLNIYTQRLTEMSKQVSALNQRVLLAFGEQDYRLLAYRDNLIGFIENLYKVAEQERQIKMRQSEDIFLHHQRQIRDLMSQCEIIEGRLKTHQRDKEELDRVNDEVKRLLDKMESIFENERLDHIKSQSNDMIEEVFSTKTILDTFLSLLAKYTDKLQTVYWSAIHYTSDASTTTNDMDAMLPPKSKTGTELVKAQRPREPRSRRNSEPAMIFERVNSRSDKYNSNDKVELAWTYRCELNEVPGEVNLTDVKYMGSDQIVMVDSKMCQMTWLDKRSGQKRSEQSFKRGNPMVSKVTMKPFAMTFDPEGHVFISDKKGACVRHFHHTDHLENKGSLGKNHCRKPRGVAMLRNGHLALVDKSYGMVLTIDTSTQDIVSKFDLARVAAREVDTPSMPVLEYAQFDPYHNRLFVSDFSMHRIHVIDPCSGKYLTSFGGGNPGTPGRLYEPQGICIDPLRGHVIVADLVFNSTAETGRLAMFETDGRLLESFTATDFHPRSVDVSISGDQPEIVVANSTLATVSRYQLYPHLASVKTTF